MRDERVILVGGFLEIIELCEACNQKIVGIIDNNPEQELSGYEYLGTDKDAQRIYDNYSNVPVVVSPDYPVLRMSLAEHYAEIGFQFATLVHPTAIISCSADIKRGSVIKAGSHISSSVRIGEFVVVNACANIMHDCSVGDYTTVAPNAVLLGKVKTGKCAYIGANATILPGRSVGGSAMVGAGAVVTKDVASDVTVVGVPAKQQLPELYRDATV